MTKPLDRSFASADSRAMALPKLNSVELAEYLLSKTGAVSHLKLQKLLYYVQAYHLAILDEPIITEDFEAWMHGPVVRRVWDAYRHLSVKNDSFELTEAGQQNANTVALKMNQDQRDLIDDVVAEYGQHSAYKLECLTHSEQPWIEARAGLPADVASSKKISEQCMKAFYSQLIYQGDDAPASN